MENRVGFIIPGKDVTNGVRISMVKYQRFFAILYIGKFLGFFPISLDAVTLQSGKRYYQLTCRFGKTFQSFYRYNLVLIDNNILQLKN
jgi:hypothetical protein